jgi:ComF family protein
MTTGILNSTADAVNDLFCLFFPNLCAGCGRTLMRGEKVICTHCRFHLPKTYFHHDTDNPLTRVFWGRVNLEGVAAYVYFQKGSTVQHLLHQLKYKGNKEIGIQMGRLYGLELNTADVFRDTELIIPVPLHPRKLRTRGYNQSEMFAEGLAAVMQAKLETRVVYRKVYSQTQTRKSRYSRWENVESIFVLKNPDRIKGKHILLVDDVITTGATTEACAHVLQQVPGVRVSVASIAYASF